MLPASHASRVSCSEYQFGKPVTEQKVKRRLAAILAADIAGYSRLMGQNDVATVHDLKGHQAVVLPLVGEFGGRIIDTAGDGILAEFPSAIAAVECASQIQKVMAARNRNEPENRRMQFRVGINLGDVIHDETRIYGDGINIAARLENIAQPGGICISEDVYRQIRDKLDLPCRDLGEQTLKNISRPVRVYALAVSTGDVDAKLSAVPPPLGLAQPSIVVLPFVNISGDRENEYFADGLSEELLNVLVKIRGLRVTSRTSAFSFKGKDIDISAIAQKLGVAHVLEGSVRKSGKRVRITAQLIEVATDSHLWSNTYDRELDDIFAVQDDIAQSVVKELRSALFGGKPDASESAAVKAEVHAAAKGRGANSEAYQLYLQGRFFGERMGQGDSRKAIEYYSQALKLDPQYAMAWVGLSRVYGNQAGFSLDLDIAESFGKARQAAERALQLEPDLAEGHESLGLIRMAYDWDWEGADASLLRALELAPGDAQVIRSRALLVGNLGRMEEGIALLRRAVGLDPLSVRLHRGLAMLCLRAGRADDAATAAAKAVELNPSGGLSHFWLGVARLMQGRLEEALDAVQKEPHETFRLLGVTLVQHARGCPRESEIALQELIAKNAAGSAYQIAEAHAYRGQSDLAFEWLERAYAQRDPGVCITKVDTLLRSLVGDPRWQLFLKKVGLAD